ncbi:atrial natriuretic peptide receptor 2-like [Glandiceps talaboti]
MGVQRSEERNFKLGWEIPWNSSESIEGYHCLGPRTASAVPMAMEKIHEEGIIGNNTMDFVIADSKCDSSQALGRAIELVMDDNVDGMLGPPCSGPCYIVSTLTSFFSLAMSSWFCVGQGEISNKTLHPFTSRTIDPIHKWSPLSVSIMQEFGWNTAAIITKDASIYREMASSIEHDLKSADMYVSGVFAYETDISLGKALEIMRDVKRVARIIFTIVGTITVLEDDEQLFMLAASELNMVSGEYVFINFEMFTDRPLTRYWVPTNRIPELEDKVEELEQAYRAMMHVTFDLPWADGFWQFLNQIIPNMANPPFYLNVTEYDASVMAGYLYDTVLLYAHAINRSMEYGQSVDDPYVLTDNMRDIDFEGITGHVIIDGEGDRRSKFILKDLQNNVFNWTIFRAVGSMDGMNYTFQRITNISIDWPGRDIPKDSPRCGFHGEFCWDTGQIVGMAIGVVAAFIAIIIAGLFGYRYHKEAVKKRQWLLSHDELQIIPSSAGASDFTAISGFQSRISKFKLNRNSSHPSAISSLQGLDKGGFRGDSAFALAIYNAQTVAVKRIQNKNISLSNTIKLELSNMKQVTHDNINRFVGICPPDSKSIDVLYYVIEYCPKGSLMDVLENDDIKLDMTFKFSFLDDVARGMSYLHSTEIRSHGMLKSSKCLIDSRWVIKIADYGLIADQIDRIKAEEKESEARFRRMLWTAPELLRLECPSKGSQKGDVYSFAIIMQEIVTRTGPYPNWDGSPKDVVRRVMKREDPPFRPDCSLDGDSLHSSDSQVIPKMMSLMERCWEEKPEDRPDFYTVRQRLRGLNKGKKRGLMDNMVLMLEKYTENLEGIVAERTSQLVEEKRKTDQLLFRMLPPTVAEQLKRGQSVEGEFFEQVTISFSDIVGFTTLAAQSTPMEVVTFLNDLYFCFDDIIANFGVYKIETIGDAYMVASGLPERNGNRHAGEIGSMALSLLHAVKDFKIKHQPKEILKVRIGINTGPVAAGVIGQTMPRYCLFGDTVNTASRMESHGEPHTIHISDTTKALLDILGGYITESRGNLDIKGKGQMTTYWLTGKTKPKQQIENNNSHFGSPEKKFSTDTNPYSDISGDSLLSPPAVKVPGDDPMMTEDAMELTEEIDRITSASGLHTRPHLSKNAMSTPSKRSSIQSGEVTPKDVKIAADTPRPSISNVNYDR